MIRKEEKEVVNRQYEAYANENIFLTFLKQIKIENIKRKQSSDCDTRCFESKFSFFPVS